MNWHVDFACGCVYDHKGGDTYCADHTWNGKPSADNPPAERRHLNNIDARLDIVSWDAMMGS